MGGYEFSRRLLALSFASCLIGSGAYAEEPWTFYHISSASAETVYSIPTGSGSGSQTAFISNGGQQPGDFVPLSISIGTTRSFSYASLYALPGGSVALPAVNAQTYVSATYPLDLDMGEIARAESTLGVVYRYLGDSERPLTITATLTGSAPAELGGGYSNPCLGGMGFCGFPPFPASRSGVVRATVFTESAAESQAFALGLPSTGQISQDSVSWMIMLQPSASFLLHLNLFTEVGAGGVDGSALGTINVAFDDASELVSLIPVPEPSTYALMLAGLGLVAGLSRRRKCKVRPETSNQAHAPA